jgi:hypothetical protein
MNISKMLALHELITNDAYAITFQSLPQYRTALRNLLIADQPAPTVPATVFSSTNQQYADWCERHDLPPHQSRDAFDDAASLYLVAHQPAQEQAEPTWGVVETVGDMVRNLLTLDQAAPVFTAFHVTIDGQRRCRVTQGITISRERVVDGKWIDSARKDVPYANIVWAKPEERAQQEPVAAPQQAAAPGALLAILRDVHDTLESQSDSDIDHFEDDEEEREGAPMQYAARRVMEVMDMLKATATSSPGTREAPKGGA